MAGITAFGCGKTRFSNLRSQEPSLPQSNDHLLSLMFTDHSGKPIPDFSRAIDVQSWKVFCRGTAGEIVEKSTPSATEECLSLPFKMQIRGKSHVVTVQAMTPILVAQDLRIDYQASDSNRVLATSVPLGFSMPSQAPPELRIIHWQKNTADALPLIYRSPTGGFDLSYVEPMADHVSIHLTCSSDCGASLTNHNVLKISGADGHVMSSNSLTSFSGISSSPDALTLSIPMQTDTVAGNLTHGSLLGDEKPGGSTTLSLLTDDSSVLEIEMMTLESQASPSPASAAIVATTGGSSSTATATSSSSSSTSTTTAAVGLFDVGETLDESEGLVIPLPPPLLKADFDFGFGDISSGRPISIESAETSTPPWWNNAETKSCLRSISAYSTKTMTKINSTSSADHYTVKFSGFAATISSTHLFVGDASVNSALQPLAAASNFGTQALKDTSEALCRKLLGGLKDGEPVAGMTEVKALDGDNGFFPSTRPNPLNVTYNDVAWKSSNASQFVMACHEVCNCAVSETKAPAAYDQLPEETFYLAEKFSADPCALPDSLVGRKLNLVVSGVSSQGCPECAAMNQTWQLSYEPVPGTAFTPTGQYHWSKVARVCGTPIATTATNGIGSIQVAGDVYTSSDGDTYNRYSDVSVWKLFCSQGTWWLDYKMSVGGGGKGFYHNGPLSESRATVFQVSGGGGASCIWPSTVNVEPK